MKAEDFQKRCPKPWHLERTNTGFSLKAANGQSIAYLNTSGYHSGIPQDEWNTQFAAALKEYFPVVKQETTTERRKPDSESCLPRSLSS